MIKKPWLLVEFPAPLTAGPIKSIAKAASSWLGRLAGQFFMAWSTVPSTPVPGTKASAVVPNADPHLARFGWILVIPRPATKNLPQISPIAWLT